MKNLLAPSRTLATSLLLGASLSTGAQTLGPLRAEAWIGRPFEASLPTSLPDAEARDECLQADLWYGDSRVSARATVVGAPNGQRRVRITSDRLVDEPVVTVAVRAGCVNTVARNYTVLPELASQPVLAAMAAPRSAPPAGLLTTALPATQMAGASPARPMVLKASVPGRDNRRARGARAPRRDEGSAASPGPRLRLDTWEPDARTLLRVSASLSDPGQDLARRATAAMLWQVLNADPSELLRTSVALQKLEGELAQLRQANGATRAELAVLRQRLDAGPPDSFPLRLAQFLAFMLALAGATAAVLWWRNQRQQPAPEWTGKPLESDSVLPAQQPVSDPVVAKPARFVRAPAARPQQAADSAAPARAPARPGGPLVRQPAVPAGGARGGTSKPKPLPRVVAPTIVAPSAEPVLDDARGAGMLRVETLAATFEEVDFLTSLGLWNDATDVLKAYLEDSGSPAPLAFFQLMRLYVNTDDAGSLAAVRKRYAQVFGKEAPKFEKINSTLGLEHYPGLATYITRAWGTSDALDFIELSLFTVPSPEQAFSLEAGRDLLSLYDLAVAVAREAGTAPAMAGDGEDHALAPWANAEGAAEAEKVTREAVDVQGGHRFALDLDLGAGPAEELPDSQDADLVDSGLLAAFEESRRAHEAQNPGRSDSRPAPLSADEDAFSAAVSGEHQRRPGKR